MDKDNFIRSAELLKLDGITLLNLEIENETINAKIIDEIIAMYHKWLEE